MLATPMRSLATSLLLVAAPFSSASAIEPRQQQPPGRPWISIDSTGEAHTFTRHVTTSNGAVATADAQPYSLTNTVFTYTTGSTTTTSTGSALPPRATDSSGGRGYFIQCMGGSASNVQPFCQPQNNARFYIDIPYYITWDRSAFGADLDTPVHLEGFHRQAGQPAINDSTTGTPSFTITSNNATPLSRGHLVWTPKDDLLDNMQVSREFTLRLAFNSTTDNKMAYRTGATITLLPKDQEPQFLPVTNEDDNKDDNDNNSGGGGGGGVPAAAIAVPIVIVVLIAAAIAAFFLIRKRRRNQGAAGVPNRGSSAFGNRGSAQYNQKPNQDIELTTSPTSPRGQGGNVFQEEIERQNRERAV
ncbi:hypothetical protein F5X68DRAFT_274778 [Plectosphaerella plurivora]|uniref:Uncharacterized protein n=1 Tax=Plectosphaerella plurivora TaxID=936078 RepID=A0A9P8VG38_9PEZI|nr:hypothetical protein F5X68DRAFT_274778 [Plectosphaerella plurivora]